MAESFQGKPKSSKKNQSALENLDPGVPSQIVIENGSRECTKVLKTLERVNIRIFIFV